MKKSKFTEAQIMFALKQAETGTTVTRVRYGYLRIVTLLRWEG